MTFSRAIRKIATSWLSAAAQLPFAHIMALSSWVRTGGFSCEHEIRLHEPMNWWCKELTYDHKIDMSRGMSIFVFGNQDYVIKIMLLRKNSGLITMNSSTKDTVHRPETRTIELINRRILSRSRA